jgi:hypothetical protein|tara:strand:+ start:7647 stop:7895 length:249 start_codon:yes stop_codon:yes gene_type:complete
MLNPVINWFPSPRKVGGFGSHDEAALFRRFLIQTLGYDMKATGDVLRIMTVIAGIDATGEEKDEMVARIVGYRNDLDWRDYK